MQADAEGRGDFAEIHRQAAAGAISGDSQLLIQCTAGTDENHEPALASFYPFAAYSPEWRAIHWALANGRWVRFIDLPATHELALTKAAREAQEAAMAVAAGEDGNGADDGAGTLVKAADDKALLKGLPKIKTTATWVPWTNTRLAASSGYGAGVASPGWYAHIWDGLQRAKAKAAPGSFLSSAGHPPGCSAQWAAQNTVPALRGAGA